jgi:hypothetical protein
VPRISSVKELDWQTITRAGLSRKGFSAHWQTRLSLIRVNPDKPRSRGQSVLVVCRSRQVVRVRADRVGYHLNRVILAFYQIVASPTS